MYNHCLTPCSIKCFETRRIMDTIPTRVSLGLIHQSITGKLGPLEGHFKAAHLSVEM